MNEQLEKAREWLEDISLHPTRTGDTQHAEVILAATELVVQMDVTTTSGCLPEQQAEQPEVDPELVEEYRKGHSDTLNLILWQISDQESKLSGMVAAIHAVLAEREGGSSDGKAE